MRLAKGFGLLVCFGGLFSLTGCNKSMPSEFGQAIPVQGQVTLAGKPLTGGRVAFFPLDHDTKNLQPTGHIDAQGNYSVSCYGNQGAPAGKYRVTVDPDSDDKNMDRQVNGVYLNWQKSPLTVTVQENAPAGAYDLKLEMQPR